MDRYVCSCALLYPHKQSQCYADGVAATGAREGNGMFWGSRYASRGAGFVADAGDNGAEKTNGSGMEDKRNLARSHYQAFAKCKS